MSVNWTRVKAKLLRRKIVDVHLPVYDEAAAEARIDRESDSLRRCRLGLSGDDGDRHEVRDRYREVYGAP